MGVARQKTCRNCGKVYAARRGPFSCSLTCRDEYSLKVKRENANLSRACVICKKTYTLEYGMRNRKTSLCSRSCIGEFNRQRITGTMTVARETVPCVTCEKHVERLVTDIKKRFCSKSCRSKHTWITRDLTHKMVAKRYVVTRFNGEKLIVRSRYEAIFIQDFLDVRNIIFKYEPEAITLPDGRTYTPDFYLEEDDIYVELKGFERGPTVEKVGVMRKMGHNVLYISGDMLADLYGLDLSAKHLNMTATEVA